MVNGVISITNEVEEVINTYLTSDINELVNQPEGKRCSKYTITGIKVVNKKGDSINAVLEGDDFGFILGIKGLINNKVGIVNIGVYNIFEEKIIHLSSLHCKEIKFTRNDPYIKCIIRKNLLRRGSYYINVSLFIDGLKVEYIQRAFTFNVISGSFFKNGNENIGWDARVLADSEWSVNYD